MKWRHVFVSSRGLMMSLWEWLSSSVGLKLSFVKPVAFIRVKVLSNIDALTWSNTTAHKSVHESTLLYSKTSTSFFFLYCYIGPGKDIFMSYTYFKVRIKDLFKAINKELVWNVWIRSAVKTGKLSIMLTLKVPLIAR